MITRLYPAIMLALIASACGQASSSTSTRTKPAATTASQNMTTLKIQMTVNGKAAIATLADNPAARDFYSMLPMTLTLNDYASTEKVATMPRALSKDGAPKGYTPVVGDVAYYAPWGNLAIYYKDFEYSDGLMKLGTIDSGLDA